MKDTTVVMILLSLCAGGAHGESQCALDFKTHKKTTAVTASNAATTTNLNAYALACIEKGECTNTYAAGEAYKDQCATTMCHGIQGSVCDTQETIYDVGGQWCVVNSVYQEVSFKALNGVQVTKASIAGLASFCAPPSCTTLEEMPITCNPLTVTVGGQKYSFQCSYLVSCGGKDMVGAAGSAWVLPAPTLKVWDSRSAQWFGTSKACTGTEIDLKSKTSGLTFSSTSEKPFPTDPMACWKMAGQTTRGQMNVAVQMQCTGGRSIKVNLYMQTRVCTGTVAGFVTFTSTQADVLRKGGCAKGTTDKGATEYMKISGLQGANTTCDIDTTSGATETRSAFYLAASVVVLSLLQMYMF